MRSCAKGAPGGPEKKGPSPPRRRRPPDSDVEGATFAPLSLCTDNIAPHSIFSATFPYVAAPK